MEAINGIKIFQMDMCDWWAGRSLEECIAAWPEHYREEFSLEVADPEPHELTDAEIDRLVFVEDDGARLREGAEKPFRQKLQEMIAEGATFPTFFASTEY
jgi:hypothetical protein